MVPPRVLLLCALAFLPIHLRAQAHKAPPLNINEIIDHAIARGEQEDKDEKNGRELVGTQHTTTEDFNDNGSVKEHSEFIREPVVIGGRVFMRTVSRNGQPLSGKYLSKEKDREKKFRDTVARNKDEAKRRDEDQDVKLDRELFNRFLVSLEGEESVNGRTAWLLSFHPKPGEKPERTRAERVVNHLAGKIWIDQHAYEIVRADLSLTQPVTFYGVVANIRALHFQLEQKAVGEFWHPSFLDMRVEGRALLTSLHQHSHSDFSNFRMQSDLH